MSKFLDLLEQYGLDDVSDVRPVFESIQNTKRTVISEAFKTEFKTKDQALFALQHEFTNAKLAPKNVDVEYVKENLDELKAEIETLSEGDIRIIIHNHEGKKDDTVTTTPDVGIAEEGVAPKKRGRPKKTKELDKIPKETEDDTLEEEGDIDPATPAGGEEVELETEEIPVEGETEELEEIKWEDVEKSVSEEPEEDSEKVKDDLVDKLNELNLTDEEVKHASSMVEGGALIPEESDDKVSQAARIIGKLNKMD